MDYMKAGPMWGVCATLVLLTLGITSFYAPSQQLLAPKPAAVTSRSTKNDCANSSFVSFQPEGRLGNRVCEYIHLFQFHLKNSVNAGVHPEMWKTIHAMFPSISLKPLTAECFKKLDHHKEVYNAILANPSPDGTKQVMLTGTPCKPTLFWDARDHWRRELLFAPDLQRNASDRTALHVDKWQQQQQQTTETITEPPAVEGSERTPAPPPAPVVVGVHVRRGDYQELLDRYSNDGLLPASYYHRAFQHYRERFERPVFLVLTEPSERDWCRKELANGSDDVIVVDDSATAEQDLALLASTKHIVYSHGTFGLVGILLSDAKTVVYPGISADNSKKRYALHENLDILSKRWTSVEFVTISSDEHE